MRIKVIRGAFEGCEGFWYSEVDSKHQPTVMSADYYTGMFQLDTFPERLSKYASLFRPIALRSTEIVSLDKSADSGDENTER